MENKLEKSGTSGTILAAIACPICFPKFAMLGALLGLGGLVAYEAYFIIAVQVLVLLALAGHYLAYRRHRNWRVLLCAAMLSLGFFPALYLGASEWLLYAIFAGFIGLSWWLVLQGKRQGSCELQAGLGS